MIRNATVPEGVPALHYPLDTYGYLLVPGRKYHKLAHADHARDGEPAGQSILCFVEFATDGTPVLYRAKSWKQRGARMVPNEALSWRPYVEAAKAWLDGTGPATWVAERTVDIGDGYGGRRVETAPVEGWTSERLTGSDGFMRFRTVWTHAATGAVVEDRTYDVADFPARGADALVAYVGHPGGDATRWAEFETFAQAAAYALT